ncbi:DNA ligase-associated DEXH box helicase, partial [bacterium]
TWGVSATLGNLEEARDTLLAGEEGSIVHGERGEPAIIDSILPERIERFPWAGHLGKQMVGPVVQAIEESQTCLVFTNTRAHSELWYQEILALRPDWEDVVALHHGSMARETRDEVENGLKAGSLRAVVCTSSLDLGVDFPPVDRVIQIGSPKGVGRLLQRAGRSGHRPGVASRVSCVPTHAFELVEVAAAREAAEEGHIEPREGLRRPLDVLAQHLVTVACGSSFRGEEMRKEVERTHAYRGLTDAEWGWTIDFVTRGGESLRAYPEYRRVTLGEDGVYRVDNEEIARRHRMSVGTIVSDSTISVQYLKGGKLGSIEESFLARLKPGDRFLFAGRSLEFIRVKDMTAWVRRAPSVGGVPRWSGARMPLSGELAQSMRMTLAKAKDGILESPEMRALAPILELQARWSAIPDETELLIEHVRDREGHHVFFYPFEGRLVNEGLAALLAHRLARRLPITFTFSMNDYGFELLSPDPPPLDEALDEGLFDPEGVADDVETALNSGEMARRQFREIARVAGLVFPGFPGMGKNAKQLQASSGLFYDVFERYDPDNLLLRQARREVLERQLEESRLIGALHRLRAAKPLQTNPRRHTPLAFPLLVDRWRETVSSESLTDRIARMTAEAEEEAG